MKKLVIILECFLIATILSGCGNKKTQEPVTSAQVQPDRIKKELAPQAGSGKIDYDLSDMNYNIITSMNFDMAISPEKYYGKTIKMKGQFFSFEEPGNPRKFFSCVVYDPTACCQAGIDFSLPDDKKYPDDYPPEETLIEITGPFTDFSYLFDDGRFYAGILCDKIDILNN